MLRRSQRRTSASLALFFALSTCLVQASTTDNSFCWKDSFSRGVGSLPTTGCPQGMTQQGGPGGLCYGSCDSGWEAYSPTDLTCVQTCPAGWTDLPLNCTKPGNITTAGYPWKAGDPDLPNNSHAYNRCMHDHGDVGCFESGSIYYPNCPANYHHNGNTICTPDCPAGMTDGGVTCQKANPRGRSSSIAISGCGSGRESDAGLCYPACGSGFSGAGPICWGICSGDHPFQCGAACATDEAACQSAVGNMVSDTVEVALNIGAMALGGPGLSSAFREGMEAGEVAAQATKDAAESGESVLLTSTKDYALAFGKKFVKTIQANGEDPRNKFWSALKKVNGDLSTINKASTEYGTQKSSGISSGGFDLDSLTALDPTGISSMVLAFTKYGSCNVGQFSVDRNELNFGSVVGSAASLNVTLTAQQPTTITRIVSPALSNAFIYVWAPCVGQQLRPGDTCTITVSLIDSVNTDSEVRIYTDKYTSVPYPIHILANQTESAQLTAMPNVDESTTNGTPVMGVWAINGDQSKKIQVSELATTYLPTGAQADYQALGDAGRAFDFAVNGTSMTMVLNATGDRLTGTFNQLGAIAVKSTGKILDVSGGSTADGAVVDQWNAVGQPQEAFTLNQQSDGTYQIQTFSGKVLDVTGNSTADGAYLEQWTWNGGANQRFRIEPVGNGSYYRIISVGSGLAVTVTGDLNANGSRVIQSAWSDLPGQQFVMSPSSTWIRRPWFSGCNPGETLFPQIGGLCYDVPAGKAMTTPGIMGAVCPQNWRDDGTACWPPWTGPTVPQADRDRAKSVRMAVGCYVFQPDLPG